MKQLPVTVISVFTGFIYNYNGRSTRFPSSEQKAPRIVSSPELPVLSQFQTYSSGTKLLYKHLSVHPVINQVLQISHILKILQKS